MTAAWPSEVRVADQRRRRPPYERGRVVVLQVAVIQPRAHRLVCARARPIERGPRRRAPRPGQQQRAHEESHPCPDESLAREGSMIGARSARTAGISRGVGSGGRLVSGGRGGDGPPDELVQHDRKACARSQRREGGMSTLPSSSTESVEVPSPTCAPRAACPRCRRSCHDRNDR